MGWFEISEVPIIDKYLDRLFKTFNEVWLSRYPRLRIVIFDNDSELKRNFIPFPKYFSVKPTCTDIKNPQGNSILERIHQVVSSMLKTKDLANATFDAVAPWSDIFASMVYVVQCSYHSTLQATPRQLFFGRDILLDTNFQTNYREM